MDVQIKILQDSSLFEGILSQEWKSCLHWWKVIIVTSVVLRLKDRYETKKLQASQESAEILRNDEAQLSHCLLHPLGKHSFPPDVQLSRQDWSRQCLLHHPHPLRRLWPLRCGLNFSSKNRSKSQQLLRSQYWNHSSTCNTTMIIRHPNNFMLCVLWNSLLPCRLHYQVLTPYLILYKSVTDHPEVWTNFEPRWSFVQVICDLSNIAWLSGNKNSSSPAYPWNREETPCLLKLLWNRWLGDSKANNRIRQDFTRLHHSSSLPSVNIPNQVH